MALTGRPKRLGRQARGWTQPLVTTQLRAGSLEKGGGRPRIEVEHLGPGELAVTHLVQAEDLGFKALAVGAHGPGSIADHHLVPIDGNDPRIEAPFGFGRLERSPGSDPGLLRLRLDLLLHDGLTAHRPAVGKRRGFVKLDLIVVEPFERLTIADLDRVDDV